MRRVLLIALVVCACGREPSSEDRIREVIAEAEQAAEARDVSDAVAVVSDSYSDTQGRDKADIRDLLRVYFVINQSIHLLTRVQDVKLLSEDLASAQVTVGMVGRQNVAAEDWSLAADIYEFDIRLLREAGDWRVQSAQWRRSAP